MTSFSLSAKILYLILLYFGVSKQLTRPMPFTTYNIFSCGGI